MVCKRRRISSLLQIYLGDINGAWAQGNRANDEFLIVEFGRAVYPVQIHIYETFNPGAVVKVSVRNGKPRSIYCMECHLSVNHRKNGK